MRVTPWVRALLEVADIHWAHLNACSLPLHPDVYNTASRSHLPRALPSPPQMSTQRYSVTPHPIETLLTWVKSEEIAIPEIQRPFVWEATKVRNLLDLLYRGYPVGYLISWRSSVLAENVGTAESPISMNSGKSFEELHSSCALGRQCTRLRQLLRSTQEVNGSKD